MLDDIDRHRVDPLLLGELDGHHVADQGQAGEASQTGLALGPHLSNHRYASRDQTCGEGEPALHLGVLLTVTEKNDPHRAAGERLQCRPAVDFVVVEFRKHRPERRPLSVLVDLRLPSLRYWSRQPTRTVDDGYAAGQALRQIHGQLSPR